MMPEKTFVNNTQATLQMTIFVRQGLLPWNLDGTVSFTLAPSETLIVSYGDEVNTLLNGILLFTIYEGDLYSKMQFVTEVASELDNLLNTNTTISITMVITDFVYAGGNPALDAVNNAQTIPEMRAALEDPFLGLDLTVYNTLTDDQKNQVANSVLTNRPFGGYPTVLSVQIALDFAITELVDPNNIYVEAGSVGGDGSLAHPFGTIPEGIAAVNPGGIVHILNGTYPITSQIVVNKAGITLLGGVATTLLLQADIVPLLITAPNVIVDGLIMTSLIPYEKEFIQIGANNTTIRNNTIYGPFQAPPMSTWKVNRAVVSQGGLTGLLIENNNFHSLRTGMYINPNGYGAINNNIVSNTKGGFLVDGAFTTFLGNSWGTPTNEVDIALLFGTTDGPPYDNLVALSLANDNATISDQRHP